MADRVRIYEVGPRDGLQNESVAIPIDTKVELIDRLAGSGLREIEATSFVSPKAIPQLADADALLPRLSHTPEVRYPVLVPNERGMARAEAAGAKALAVFTAATDAFTQRNIGMTIEESLAAFRPVLRRAADLGWWRRAYVSTAFGCPYSGAVTAERIAFHFHDTRGTALANVAAAMSVGIRCFDSSTGGTGGCPYAPGAAGNLATEDLVYLLDAIGLEHGVDLVGVLRAARFIAAELGKPLASKVGQAGGWDPATGASTGRA